MYCPGDKNYSRRLCRCGESAESTLRQKRPLASLDKDLEEDKRTTTNVQNGLVFFFILL